VSHAPVQASHGQCHALYVGTCAGAKEISYLLDLPQDVLHMLLGRIPPKSLNAISRTCTTLRDELEDDGIWRHSYVNHFVWDGASRDAAAKEVVRVLVQGCNGGGMGWRYEGLAREAMLR